MKKLFLFGIVGLVSMFGQEKTPVEKPEGWRSEFLSAPKTEPKVTLTEVESFKIENQGLKHQNAQLSLQVLDLQKKLAEANEQLVKQADGQVVTDYNKTISDICQAADLKADNCKIDAEGADPTNADPTKRTFGKVVAKDAPKK